MVDILEDPEMVGFKKGKPIYQIRGHCMSLDLKIYIEDYKIPYRSSKAGCL